MPCDRVERGSRPAARSAKPRWRARSSPRRAQVGIPPTRAAWSDHSTRAGKGIETSTQAPARLPPRRVRPVRGGEGEPLERDIGLAEAAGRYFRVPAPAVRGQRQQGQSGSVWPPSVSDEHPPILPARRILRRSRVGGRSGCPSSGERRGRPARDLLPVRTRAP